MESNLQKYRQNQFCSNFLRHNFSILFILKKIRADIGVKPLLGVTTYKGQKKPDVS
jgi:hypothetical protein